jgi:hypothetical protein
VPGILQEGGALFPTRRWAVVLQAGEADPDKSARKARAPFGGADRLNTNFNNLNPETNWL